MVIDSSKKLVAGLYKEIFAQVDPMRLGEMDRAQQIAVQYGERLVDGGANVKENAVLRLAAGYPSHFFVIDQKEARELFEKVREPSTDEQVLALRYPVDDDKTIVVYLNEVSEGVSHEAQPSGDPGATPSPASGANGGPSKNEGSGVAATSGGG